MGMSALRFQRGRKLHPRCQHRHRLLPHVHAHPISTLTESSHRLKKISSIAVWHTSITQRLKIVTTAQPIEGRLSRSFYTGSHARSASNRMQSLRAEAERIFRTLMRYKSLYQSQMTDQPDSDSNNLIGRSNFSCFASHADCCDAVKLLNGNGKNILIFSGCRSLDWRIDTIFTI